MYQITLYTLNLYNVICKLYLNETGKLKTFKDVVAKNSRVQQFGNSKSIFTAYTLCPSIPIYSYLTLKMHIPSAKNISITVFITVKY